MNPNLKLTIKKVIHYALPIAGASWLNMIAGFVFTIFVAQISPIQLAAASLAVISFQALSVIPYTSLYAVSILMGRARGEHNCLSMGAIAKNAVWVGILIAIPCAIITWCMPKILALFGQEMRLIHLSRGFFHVASFMLVSNIISLVANQFLLGIGKPRATLIIQAICLPFTIGIAYLLILGKWGMPQLGLTGAAVAMFLTQGLFWLFMGIYLKKYAGPYQLFHRSQWFKPSLIKKIFNMGMPIGIQFGGELMARATLIYLLGLFGAIPLAASEIVNQYLLFVIMAMLGISQAVSILSSEALGQKNQMAAKHIFWSGLLIFIIVMCLVALLFLLFPKLLIFPFISSSTEETQPLIHLTMLFFYIAVIGLSVNGVRNILSAALRGYHDSKTPMLIGILCLWVVSLPVSYCVGIYFKGGPVILRLGFVSGILLATILLGFRLHHKYKASVS